MMRIIRLSISIAVVIAVTVGFIFIPFFTALALITFINCSVFAVFPYWVIAAITRWIYKANYVCIVQPYKGIFITVRKKGFTANISQKIIDHEQDHIRYFREANTTIQALKYVIYFIWYGYWDNPVEIRARRAAEVKNG